MVLAGDLSSLPPSFSPSRTSPNLVLEQTLSELLCLRSLKVNCAECLCWNEKQGSVDRGNLELGQEERCVERLQHALDGLFVGINSPVWTSKGSVFVLLELIQVIDERFTDYECLLLWGAEKGISGGLIRRTVEKHGNLIFWHGFLWVITFFCRCRIWKKYWHVPAAQSDIQDTNTLVQRMDKKHAIPTWSRLMKNSAFQ